MTEAHNRSRQVTMITLGGAVGFSIPTLVLVDTWVVKITLFSFQAALILILSRVLLAKRLGKPDSPPRQAILPRWASWELALVVGAGLLFLVNITGACLGIIQAGLALAVVGFLAGRVILGLFNLPQKLTRLETVVLAVLTSFIFTGGVELLMSGAPPRIKPALFSLLIVAEGVLALVVKARRVKTPRGENGAGRAIPSDSEGENDKVEDPLVPPYSFCGSIDKWALALTISFLVAIFFLQYPGLGALPFTDSSRHYMNALLLDRSPGYYWDYGLTPYVLFHAFNAGFYQVAGRPSLLVAQCTPYFLTLVLPLVFYCLAKRYLGKNHPKAPVLVLLLWTFFSNLSFLVFIYSRLNPPGLPELYSIWAAANRSYNGTIYGFQPYLYFLPLTVSYCLLFTALVLVRNETMTSKQLTGCLAALVFGMYLTHVAETIIFTVILAIIVILARNENVRTREAVVGAILGFLPAAVIGLLLPSSYVAVSPWFQVAAPGALLALCLIWENFLGKRVKFPPEFRCTERALKAITIGCLFLTTLSLSVWFTTPYFSTIFVSRLGVVPWYVFPGSLGVVGVLAIFSIRYANEKPWRGTIGFLLAVLACLILFGRLISLVNVTLFFSNYWENRLFAFYFVFACLLGTVVLIDAFQSKINGNDSLSVSKKNGWGVCLVGTIVFFGFSSVPVQQEYWYLIQREPDYSLDQDELDALEDLNALFIQDPSSYVITTSSTSQNALTFSGPAYRLASWAHFLTARRPELPLFLRNWDPAFSHAYIYIHERDRQALAKYPGNHVATFLEPSLPIALQGNQTTVYNSTSGSYPRVDGDAHLLSPYQAELIAQGTWVYACEILSQNFVDFTVMYDIDHAALQGTPVFLSFDPVANSSENYTSGRPISEYVQAVTEGTDLVVLNTNGAGFFTDRYLACSTTNSSWEGIGGPGELNFSETVEAPTYTPVNASHAVRANFTGNGQASVFVISESMGAGSITLVNVAPIVQHFRDHPNTFLFNSLGSLFATWNFTYPQFVPTEKQAVAASFQTIEASGRIALLTGSLLLDPEVKVNLTLRDEAAQDVVLANVTNVRISDYERARVLTPGFTMINGTGLYANPVLNRTMNCTFTGGPVSVSCTTRTGDRTTVSNVTWLEARANGSLPVQAHSPEIHVEGRIFFSHLYHSSTFDGHYGLITGATNFTILYSDYYSFASRFTYRGEIVKSPLDLNYNPLNSILWIAIWGLVWGPIFSFLAWRTLKTPGKDSKKFD